jgi:hypothetical protein
MGVGSSFGSFPGGGGTGGSCIGVGLGVRSGGWIGGRFLSGSGGGSTGGRRVKKMAEILRISWDMRLLTPLRKHACSKAPHGRRATGRPLPVVFVGISKKKHRALITRGPPIKKLDQPLFRNIDSGPWDLSCLCGSYFKIDKFI